MQEVHIYRPSAGVNSQFLHFLPLFLLHSLKLVKKLPMFTILQFMLLKNLIRLFENMVFLGI